MFALRLLDAPMRRNRSRPGFTLVELLVVMAVVSILAALVLPVVTRALGSGETTKCLTQIRQIQMAFMAYVKDADQWMPCAGNLGKGADGSGTDEHTRVPPIYEGPWYSATWTMTLTFKYWYEAMQPYINLSATVENALKAYKERTGTDLVITPPLYGQPTLRTEQARLMQIISCPSKRMAPVGYGYHYTAPFGNSHCYPNSRDTFTWFADKQHTIKSSSPINVENKIIPIPILWYEQYIHSGVITNPSAQIAFCDTGRITNTTRNESDSSKWVEVTTPSSVDFSNTQGYVRFPLMGDYWYPPTGTNADTKFTNYPWRPVGRHGGRVASAFFDGSCRAVPIRDVCSPNIEWGDAPCLYDNAPPYRPPVAPLPRADY